ncbi:MAG: hypothetical protein M3Q10_08065 [Chloroflexota bacterium]|nr:hypothetical protein [Chloroflexota bacterium]
MSGHDLSYQQLIDYAADDLEGQDAAPVAAHLAACAECSATVARYRAMRRALASAELVAPPAATMARAKALFTLERGASPPGQSFEVLDRVIARLAFDSRRSLSMSGVRSAGTNFHLMFEEDLADVNLQIERLSEREGDAWQILGQVTVDEASSQFVIGLVPVQGSRPIVEAETDENGFFTVQAVEGRYDLHIRLSSALMILPGVDVG